MKICIISVLDRLAFSIRKSFKGNVGETSARRGGAHMGFSERIDTILKETKLMSDPVFAGIA